MASTPTARSVAPSSTEIADAVAEALKETNTIPSAKELQKTLEAENPTWKLPERRVLKFLKKELRKGDSGDEDDVSTFTDGSSALTSPETPVTPPSSSQQRGAEVGEAKEAADMEKVSQNLKEKLDATLQADGKTQEKEPKTVEERPEKPEMNNEELKKVETEKEESKKSETANEQSEKAETMEDPKNAETKKMEPKVKKAKVQSKKDEKVSKEVQKVEPVTPEVVETKANGNAPSMNGKPTEREIYVDENDGKKETGLCEGCIIL